MMKEITAVRVLDRAGYHEIVQIAICRPAYLKRRRWQIAKFAAHPLATALDRQALVAVDALIARAS
jgi:hypothetical protein